MSNPLAITGGTLIDGCGGSPARDATVVVQDGRFTAIGPRAAVPVPEGADTVDATGRWILPGLMNGNVHLLDGIMMLGNGGVEYLARFEGRLHKVVEEAAQVALRAGVTTVFDTWNALAPVLTARQRIDSGQAQGARIFCAGNIVGMGGPFSADFNLAARSVISPSFANRMNGLFEAGVGHQLSLLPPQEVRAVVRDYIARGVDMVKVAVSDHILTTVGLDRTYLTFSDRVLRAIVEEVRAAGLPLLTHTMSVEALNIAVDLDADVLVHATMTGQQPIPSDILDKILRKGLWSEVQPTTTAFQAHLDSVNHPWALYGGNEHWNNEVRMIKAEAPILLGTDAGCADPDVLSSMPESELFERPWTLGEDHFLWTQAMVEKGMSPMAAILANTSNVAKAYGKTGDYGTVEAGKVADLVLLDADPLSDIKNMRTVSAVFKDGRPVDLSTLPSDPQVTLSPRPGDAG
jgi:imidazolonepropionase-like amidohydrolase